MTKAVQDTRVRLGPIAKQSASDNAGTERVTQAHLEDSTTGLEAAASLQASDVQPKPEKQARSIFEFDSACDLP